MNEHVISNVTSAAAGDGVKVGEPEVVKPELLVRDGCESRHAGITPLNPERLMSMLDLTSATFPGVSAAAADDSLLIIDARSFIAYNASHVRNAINAYYPPPAMMKRRRSGAPGGGSS